MKLNITTLKNTKYFNKTSITIPDGYLINSDIKKVKCHITGSINPELNAKINISGMLFTNNQYPFEVDIQENFAKYLKKGQKTLDINLIIWENIVLEVPVIISDNVDNVYQEEYSYVTLKGKE